MSVQSVALASLTATYTDSEGEDGADDDQQDNSLTPKGAAPQNVRVVHPRSGLNSPKFGRSASASPADVVDDFGGKSNVVVNATNATTDATSKVQRLVSYFDDTVVSDDEGTASALNDRRTDNGVFVRSNDDGVDAENGENDDADADADADRSPKRRGDSVSDGEADSWGVTIPIEPVSQCPIELQEKITKLYRKMESGGLDMNKLIQQRKDFRNPSIYEKLIQFCSINELGTNYPPDRFDPFKWPKDSYYEELAKIQKTEMDKLEKARKEKTKIEIVSGTAKRPNSGPVHSSSANAPNTANAANSAANIAANTAEDDAKRRKSKWDQVATGTSTSTKSTVLLSQPTLTTLTSSATGTKATVISAFGSLPKKRL